MKLFSILDDEDKIRFVRRYCPECSEAECLEKYDIYIAYVAEGQSSVIARQYAGML